MNPRWGGVTFVTAVALVACSPTWDWRTVALPDGGLQGAMPCRPGRFERTVALAGQPLKLFMLSCEAGGVTYALSSAEVGDSAKVEGVLAALATAARVAVAAETAASAPLQIAGATPFRGNASTRLQGKRPDGTSVQEAIAVFGQGTRVFEAAAIGDRLDPPALQPFMDALAFQLPR